jgi:hypothetical protein
VTLRQVRSDELRELGHLGQGQGDSKGRGFRLPYVLHTKRLEIRKSAAGETISTVSTGKRTVTV